MIQCKYCKADKADDLMKLRAGKPSKVCIACDEAGKTERDRIRKIAENARNGRRGPKRKKKTRAAPRATTPAAAPTPVEITVDAGSGFKAYLLEDDRLQIDQANGDGSSDSVVLSRTEFKVLTAQFTEWRDASIQ